MERITKNHLKVQVTIANNKFGGPNPVFSLDHFSTGWRLERGGDYISPRLSTREMYYWMHGFIEGMQTIKEEGLS